MRAHTGRKPLQINDRYNYNARLVASPDETVVDSILLPYSRKEKETVGGIFFLAGQGNELFWPQV